MPQADFTPTTLSTEASLYTGKDRKLAWTARTKIRNAGWGERAAAIDQYVDVLVEAMEKDRLF